MTLIRRIRESIGIKLSDNIGIIEILNAKIANKIIENIDIYSLIYV